MVFFCYVGGYVGWWLCISMLICMRGVRVYDNMLVCECVCMRVGIVFLIVIFIVWREGGSCGISLYWFRVL